jgi:hypothetical protein
MVSTTTNTKSDPVTLATRTNSSIDLKERLFGLSVRVKVIPALGKERTWYIRWICTQACDSASHDEASCCVAQVVRLYFIGVLRLIGLSTPI